MYPNTATIRGFDADADAVVSSVLDFLAAGDAEAEAGDGEEDMMEAVVVAVVTAVEAKFLREMESGRALMTPM